METSTNTYTFMDEFQGELAPVSYAGFWRRFVAAVIDSFVIGIPNWIITTFIIGGTMATTEFNPDNPFAILAAMSTSMMLTAVLTILYSSIMESSSWQATLGKRALDMKVTDENGQRISFGRALGRTLSKYLSTFILFIGYIMAAFSSRKQALHDKIASTLVVKTR
ncbi:RDD family protein [Rufibacter roseus]|uniref:RDD family protein n=1 Tax=Rufibacter roseus TaxID=1567108 RepID=A0ABW2DE70_9BACT|nr:RDD family protein [Rufibacter roseus]